MKNCPYCKEMPDVGKLKNIFIIGIDPDCDKSGIAIITGSSKTLDLSNWRFFEMFEYLRNYAACIEKIYIEAGWLNKSNWHVRGDSGVKYAANIGQRTGANFEVGKKIAEMCEFLQIDFELVKPQRSKLNAETFKRVAKYEKRTNQEQRDAAMLILGL